jgi:hypothetical protein
MRPPLQLPDLVSLLYFVSGLAVGLESPLLVLLLVLLGVVHLSPLLVLPAPSLVFLVLLLLLVLLEVVQVSPLLVLLALVLWDPACSPVGVA